MTEQELLKKDYDLIVQAWQILKKYHKIESTSEYWESLIKEIADFKENGLLGYQLGEAIITTIDHRDHYMKTGEKRW